MKIPTVPEDGGEIDPAGRDMLVKVARTSLNSKLVHHERDFFADMVVDAVLCLGEGRRKELIGVKKVPGGSLGQSMLIQGVAFKKTFSYAGFEQQPKHFKNPKIALLNIELELKAELPNAEVRLNGSEEFAKVVASEWDIIYAKLDKIVKSGAQIVLSKLPIGDLATQYFADRGMFCAGRVEEGDMQRIAKATSARVQTTVSHLSDDVLGTCGDFSEEQVGGERYNFFRECSAAKSATILLRGGSAQYIEESARSLNDAIMVVRRALAHSSVVAGGGAIEMRLSKFLRAQSLGMEGKEQLIIGEFAKALEVIPRTVADNAGFDSTDIMNRLRYKHATEPEGWWGVDVANEDVCDCMETFVWEPSKVRRNVLTAATEAACIVLSVDETVMNPQSNQPQGGAADYGMEGRRL